MYTEHHQVFEKSSRNLWLNSLGPIEKSTACGILVNFTMSKSIFYQLLFIGLLFLFGAQQGFSSNPTSSPDWKQKYVPRSNSWQNTNQHFIFNNGTEPESIDPALITGVPESRIVGALFEGLVNLDPESLEIRPGVAEKWEISDDGLTYLFHLRGNAKWSNGEAVTATDFFQSWKRVLTPSTGAAYAYQLFPISGAFAYHSGKLNSFEKVGIAVINDRTLRITLKDPCAYFLDLTAFHTFFPVPTARIDSVGDRWVLPKNIISNGAFTLESWEPRQKIELKRNEQYWDRDFCKLKKVTVLPFDDLDTAYKLYLEHKISWLPGLPLAKLDEIKRNPDYYVMPYLGTYFYRFNCTKPPFNDARVRRAFSQAIDRKIITDQILKGGQEPATWFCPPVAGYKSADGLGYDRMQAKKLIIDAGYGPDNPFPKVELLYNTSESHKIVAEALVQQWKKNIGVNVTLRNTEWKVLLNDMNNLNFQMVRSSWIGDYGDPNTFFDMFVSNGGNNRTGWSNKKYDELLKQAQIENDQGKRMHLFQEMERLLIEKDFPIMPLYMYVNQGLLHENVMGWYENVRDHHPLQYIWLEE